MYAHFAVYFGHVPEVGEKIIFYVDGSMAEARIIARRFNDKEAKHYLTTSDSRYRVLAINKYNDGSKWQWVKDDGEMVEIQKFEREPLRKDAVA